MKQWQKDLMKALNREARKTDFIDFCEFYKEFVKSGKYKDIGTEEAFVPLERWLEKHQEFEFIGDDYELLLFYKQPILINSRHLWNSDETNCERAFELLRMARLCQRKYACEQAEGYAKRAYSIFKKLSAEDGRYMLFCAECMFIMGRMREEMHYDEPIPCFTRAVREYESVLENLDRLDFKELFKSSRIKGKHFWKTLTHKGEFGGLVNCRFNKIDNYINHMLCECSESLGEKFERQSGENALRNADKYYTKALDCFRFIMKGKHLEHTDSLIVWHEEYEYARLCSSLLRCRALLEDISSAETCFKEIERLERLDYGDCQYMVQAFQKAEELQKAKACFEITAYQIHKK